MKTYFVYIMAGASRTLYTGVTNNLERRVLEHRRKLLPGFTSHYNINRLVHFESFGEILDAIAREKQIKSWGRMKKIALIESANRDWKDLSAGWYGAESKTPSQAKKRQSERDSSLRSE
ncbi:MAG TPA: GIY-YIG nuclease family protein [Terriglobia bacterium]|nr:GIY-YIG nuclease family protein [Terriglobia bacterium]